MHIIECNLGAYYQRHMEALSPRVLLILSVFLALHIGMTACLFGGADRFAIGDTARTERGLDITVNGVRTSMGHGRYSADKEHHFVYVDVTFMNYSDNYDLLDGLFWKLVDGEGNVYRDDFIADLAHSAKTPNGWIVPGGKRRGEIGYEVPKKATDLTWSHAVDVLSSDYLDFSLGTSLNEKVTPKADEFLNLPATNLFNIGESVGVGAVDLEVTVNNAQASLGKARYRPNEGNYLVHVDLTFRTQTGDMEWMCAERFEMELLDGAGWAYSSDDVAESTLNDRPLQCWASSQGTLRGEIVYQVPISASQLMWKFEFGPFIPPGSDLNYMGDTSRFSGSARLQNQVVFWLGDLAIP